MKAFYFYQSRMKNIVLNTRSGPHTRKILCAHELGHALLHKEIATWHGFQELTLFCSASRAEYEANLFAADLLIEDEALFELLDEPGKSFSELARELYVPIELLDFKFRILKGKGYPLAAPYIAQADFLKGSAQHESMLQ